MTDDIFKDCHVVFWDSAGQKTRTQLVKRYGGHVSPRPSPATTHVIVRSGMTPAEAANKLALAASATRRGGAAACSPAAASSTALPCGVHFVTGDWISDSITRMKRQAEQRYLVPLQTRAVATSATAQNTSATAKDTSGSPLQPDAKTTSTAAISNTGGVISAAVPSPSAGAKRPRQRRASSSGDSSSSSPASSKAATPAACHGKARNSPPPAIPSSDAIAAEAQSVVTIPPASHTIVPAEAVHPISPQQQPQQHSTARSGAAPVLPTAADVCTSAEDWGVDGRWIEPWDQEAAQLTIDKLKAHWHRRDLKAIREPPHLQLLNGAGQAADTASSSSSSSSSSSGSGASQAPINDVCMHTACALRPFCIVAELKKTKALYGSKDHFRIKAIDNAIFSLECLGKPLNTPVDVDALKVGPKSTEKIKEVLATGVYKRNEERSLDPKRQALALFESVWGAGDVTAAKWYSEGCTTLDCVRQRTDLTTQQRLGLQFYDDFLQRIPRAEALEVEGAVREAVMQVLVEMSGLTREQLQHKIVERAEAGGPSALDGSLNAGQNYARLAGSYARGARDSSDIDFVIAPSPVARRISIPEMLQRLLEKLGPNLVAAGSHSGRRAAARDEYSPVATWLGVWRSPTSPCARRIDFKLYSHDLLPYAVNYFSSSTNFCRALRYWCNTPRPEVQQLAQAVNPNAMAFKLSDQGLWVVRQVGRDPTSILDPIPCAWETDIFKAVGLSYVPPHMRGALGGSSSAGGA